MPKGVITVLLFVAAAFLGYYFVLGEWNRYQSIQAEIAHFNDIHTELEGLVASFGDRERVFESIPQDGLAGINGAIPEGSPSRNVTVEMEYLAFSPGVSLQKIAFVAPVKKTTPAPAPATEAGAPGQPKPSGAPAAAPTDQGPQELEVQLTAVGSYENFKAFLSEVEKNLPLFDAGSLGIAVDEKNNFTVTIKLKTYFH